VGRLYGAEITGMVILLGAKVLWVVEGTEILKPHPWEGIKRVGEERVKRDGKASRGPQATYRVIGKENKFHSRKKRRN